GIVKDITERKRAEEALDKSYQIQSVLNSLLQISLEDIPLKEQLEQALDAIVSTPFLLVDLGGIFLVEDEPEVLVLKAQKNLSSSVQKECAKVPFGRCLCGRAAASGQIEFADCVDYRHETRYEGMVPHGHYSIPIESKDKILGVIVLYLHEGHCWDKREEEFLQTVANTMAGIIERKRAEEALRESEEQFRSVAQSAIDAIISADSNGIIISWNNGAQTIFGYTEETEEEVLGKPLAILMPERYRDAHREGLERFLSTGASSVIGKTVELQGLRKDGTEFPLELSLSTWKTGEGTFFSGIVRDITERKRDEEELKLANEEIRKTKRYLRSLIESATAAIIATDQAGKVVLFNQGAEALSGYRREEVLGRRVPVLYERAEDAKEVMRRMREGSGKISAYETNLRAKDGTVIPVLISSSLLYDEEGREAGTVGFSKDLRGRKQAEEALRALKEFNENVVHSIQDGLVALDRDFRITVWNNAMEEISGYTVEEVLGQVASDVFPHLIEQGGDELHNTALEGQVASRSNIPYLTPKGKAGYTNEKYLPLRDAAGQVVGTLAIVEDVTESVHLEQQIIHLQEEIERRKLVEIAKGILMQERGLSEAEAYTLIQKRSRDGNRKMVDVAKDVIGLFNTINNREKKT
ncbi:MAG: PAS domain S-box protein, partial [Dehalococcoidia bacterium]